MGLFDNLGDISMGYLARQREVQDKEADEAYQQNKSSIGNLSKFWTAAMEGSRNDPEVQQALLSRIAEVSQLDPRKAKPKDLARLADASLLWQGVKRSPESMQPKMDTMQAEVQQPSIPLPKPPGMDGGAPMASGLTSGAQMPPVQLESNIPLPAPPTEYMSVYPSQDELDFKKYGQEEAGAENALKRALAKKRGELELEKEFATTDPSVQNDFTLSPGQARYRPGETTPYASVAATPPSAGAEKSLQADEVLLKNGSRAPAFFNPDPSNPGWYQKNPDGTLRDITDQVAGQYRPPAVFQQQMNASDATDLTPQFQNAINMASIRVPPSSKPQVVRNVETYLKQGNIPAAKNYLRQVALSYEPVEERKKVSGRREAMRHMDDITAMLKEVPTGMLQGTIEQTANYLGTTKDPKLRALKSRLTSTMQAYRRAITGAAFSDKESGEYADFWADFKKDLPTNLATIQGLMGKFGADDATFWFSVFSEPGWTDAEINPQGAKGRSNFIEPPAPSAGGGSTGGGSTGGNVTRRKIDAQGNVIK